MQKLRYVLAGLVTSVWLTGYGIAYWSGRDAPSELSALMALVLGWAFAGHVRDELRKRLNGSKDQDRDA